MPRHPIGDAHYPALRQSAGIGFAAAGVASSIVGVALAVQGLSWWAPAKAITLILALAVTALPFLSSHHRERLGPANALTLLRAVGIAGIAATLGESLDPHHGYLIAMAGAVAFALDGLDGRIARSTGWSSPFGARLDMELDALTVLILCALAWQLDRVGPWILWCGAMRYLFVAASWQWPWMNAALPPAPRRAIICGLQISSVLLCLPPWPSAIAIASGALGTFALTASFAIDTLWLYQNRLHTE